ncbi:hypothetical protein KJ966_27725 [bacterium]|nr:hypothetical protein [bacterium]
MKKLSCIELLLFSFLFCFFVDHKTAIASEVGVDGEYRKIGRYHSDSESIGSIITIQQGDLFINYSLSDSLSLYYTENQEAWNLEHPDGTDYFSFYLQKHIPKIRYKAEDWDASLTLPVIDVASEDQLYTRIEDDDRNQVILPALTGEYRISNWFVDAAVWQESAIHAFDYYRYTLFLYQTSQIGGGLNLTGNQMIRVGANTMERIYPSNYDQRIDEYEAWYRFKEPTEFSDSIQWREASLKYVHTIFPDISVNKIIFANNFKFSLFSLTHFIDYELLFTDSVTLYREGLYQYSLIETDEKKNDILQVFTYSGFTRIGESSFFLSWKYSLEDSLIENYILDQLLQIKLVYAF